MKNTTPKNKQEEIEEELGGYKQIIDNLPFAVSIQDAETQVIIYENKKMQELLGSYLNKKCYTRWLYLDDWGKQRCNDCLLSLMKHDMKPHKIVRKTKDQNDNTLYVEIEHLPLTNIKEKNRLTHYMEIIRVIEINTKTEILANKTVNDLLKGLEFSIMKFGDFGGDMIISDELSFLKDIKLEEFLSRLTIYIFTGLFQGVDRAQELYGPLPVLDKSNQLMHAHVFKVANKKAKDKRKRGLEPCMLFIFYPRSYEFLFDQREKIELFLKTETAKLKSIEEIDKTYFEKFKRKIKEYIEEISR